MEKRYGLKPQLIAYYNIFVPSAFIVGAIILYLFAKRVESAQGDAFGASVIFFVALCLFSIVSGITYLRRVEIGRICLLGSCVAQALYAIRNIAVALVSSASFPIINAAILAVAVWGAWFLQSSEGRAYIQSQRSLGE